MEKCFYYCCSFCVGRRREDSNEPFLLLILKKQKTTSSKKEWTDIPFHRCSTPPGPEKKFWSTEICSRAKSYLHKYLFYTLIPLKLGPYCPVASSSPPLPMDIAAFVSPRFFGGPSMQFNSSTKKFGVLIFNCSQKRFTSLHSV